MNKTITALTTIAATLALTACVTETDTELMECTVKSKGEKTATFYQCPPMKYSKDDDLTVETTYILTVYDNTHYGKTILSADMLSNPQQDSLNRR